jgi:hypothetical protein
VLLSVLLASPSNWDTGCQPLHHEIGFLQHYGDYPGWSLPASHLGVNLCTAHAVDADRTLISLGGSSVPWRFYTHFHTCKQMMQYAQFCFISLILTVVFFPFHLFLHCCSVKRLH